MNQLTEYRESSINTQKTAGGNFEPAPGGRDTDRDGYDVAMGPDVIEPGSVGEPER